MFQTPRAELDSDEVWQNNASYAVGEILQFGFEEARNIALENLHMLAMPAILRSGLAYRGAVNDQTKALHVLIDSLSANSEDIGRVLQPLIVPIYRAIADDPRWLELEEPVSLFRDEILNQYSVAFRSEMVLKLGSVLKKMSRFRKRSPSFEDWIHFLEKNVPDFHQLIPECLVKFERGMLDGSIQANRRGIHGLALQYDARFYLDRLLDKAHIS